MAKRKVYRVNLTNKNFVDKIDIEFEWSPGFAQIQKQKNIKSLHNNYNKIYSQDKLLEISSKSNDKLGVNLSAFNLTFTTIKKNNTFSVECAFQSSKKFEFGGPYKDLLEKDSKSAKKDIRLKNSGKLISFVFFNQEWPLEPKTLFYDWLYMNALYKKINLYKEVLNFDAFTDIEFNENKSINCQAYSVALFVSLYKRGLLDVAMKSPDNYKKIILQNSNESIKNNTVTQLSLLD
ncbi:hypothetical protein M1Z64_001348 [Clostridium perfringens]|uniref:DarT1-associated NADAR antitoxin family protein n=1 Tax=Clostridium perfringens TaxID=1502 RepID=UPI0024BC5BDE|nr:hypothetical protein [Clostridium perfringens]MBS5923337.1 hypothetical protein [Clostridium perfringens]